MPTLVKMPAQLASLAGTRCYFLQGALSIPAMLLSNLTPVFR